VISLRFAIFPNLGKEKLFTFLPELLGMIEERKSSALLPLSMKEGLEAGGIKGASYGSIDELGNCDCLLSIGGDGSFLGAARTFRDYPILMAGIHLGELGFLNSITVEDAALRLDQILARHYTEESRLFLDSILKHEDGSQEWLTSVLNDVVIGHNEIGQLARLNLSVNGHLIQEYASDGLIVSSPTGSTGYALSCGGPVMGPGDDRMIVIPICAHTLQRFAIVLKCSDTVEVTAPPREKNLRISLDGSESCPFKTTDRLFIKGANKPIRFIRFADQDFFGTITKKLVRKIYETV
jgi:NAD+ kinase